MYFQNTLSRYVCKSQIKTKQNKIKCTTTRNLKVFVDPIVYNESFPDTQFQNLNASHVKVADKALKYEIIMKHTHF